jgi:hypothetical protein
VFAGWRGRRSQSHGGAWRADGHAIDSPYLASSWLTLFWYHRASGRISHCCSDQHPRRPTLAVSARVPHRKYAPRCRAYARPHHCSQHSPVSAARPRAAALPSPWGAMGRIPPPPLQSAGPERPSRRHAQRALLRQRHRAAAPITHKFRATAPSLCAAPAPTSPPHFLPRHHHDQMRARPKTSWGPPES